MNKIKKGTGRLRALRITCTETDLLTGCRPVHQRNLTTHLNPNGLQIAGKHLVREVQFVKKDIWLEPAGIQFQGASPTVSALGKRVFNGKNVLFLLIKTETSPKTIVFWR